MELLKKLSPLQAVSFTIAAVVSLAILIFMSLKLSEPPMAMLYTNLEPDDSTLITSRLTAMGIDYKVGDNGKGVLVPVAKVTQLRMAFAEEGIPRSGNISGYEIFDKNESLGTSQFVNNVNLVRALEGELARTIGSLAHVESARVHLVLPKKELFSRSTAEPSASVVIRPRGGQEIQKNEVSAITHLVATAVPGLKLENITIVDSKGRPLKLSTSSESDMAELTEGISDYQRTVENRLRDTIENMLEKSVGAGKVKASVSAEINFDREIINAEVYDPDGQVLRSRKVVEENESEQDVASGGDGGVSVSENLPEAGGGAGAGGVAGRNTVRTDELSNYEISKTVTNKISETGRIKKLSIAILVDGNYTLPKADETNEDGTPVRPQYSPRTAEELEKLRLLAASAVGLDPRRGDKIEVVNMQFMDDIIEDDGKGGKFSGLISNLENIIRTIVIGIVIILVIMLIVRPVIIKTLEARKAHNTELNDAISSLQKDIEMQAEKDAQAASDDSAPVEIIDLTAPEDKRKLNLIKQVNEIIDKHPEETVSIIRNWLYSDR